MEAGATWIEPGGVQDVEGVKLSEDVYFGWAPTTTSDTGTFNASELKIEQNGVDIVADTPIEYNVDPPAVINPNEVPLPVTDGLRARYNATSWKSNTVWEDLSGNDKHMGNFSVGNSEVVNVENADMTDNTTGGRFSYVKGNRHSRWDLGGLSGNERMPTNSWTYIHITRYEPSGSKSRILGGVGDNVLFGTWSGKTGVSYHGTGWVELHPDRSPYGLNTSHWLFQIDRPGKVTNITTADDDDQWTDLSNGVNNNNGNINMSWRPVISGHQGASENSSWNIAELILFDRVLSDSEVGQFQTWMMDYKAGFSASYPSIDNSPSYWQLNRQPIVYRKTEATLDGSQLIAKQSFGSWPKDGYIVSASDPAGRWTIRGGWFDQSGSSLQDVPLSTTHETDEDGWRKVTECPKGEFINNPFSGTTQSDSVLVEVPIAAMSEAGEYGRDVELKVVVTHNNGNEYEVRYKNWMLNHVFDSSHITITPVYTNDGPFIADTVIPQADYGGTAWNVGKPDKSWSVQFTFMAGKRFGVSGWNDRISFGSSSTWSDMPLRFRYDPAWNGFRVFYGENQVAYIQIAFQSESLSDGVYYEFIISYPGGYTVGGYVPWSALTVRYRVEGATEWTVATATQTWDSMQSASPAPHTNTDIRIYSDASYPLKNVRLWNVSFEEISMFFEEISTGQDIIYSRPGPESTWTSSDHWQTEQLGVYREDHLWNWSFQTTGIHDVAATGFGLAVQGVAQGFRYWGVGSKNGAWSNNYYRYIWATFYDENDVLLNDANFKHVTGVSNGVPTFNSTSSPNFQSYTDHHHSTDPVKSGDMNTKANWSLYQYPAMYVDLGSPKDVRKVLHMARNNHVMYDPIIVASNDEVNWTIVKEFDQSDNSNSNGYGTSTALWLRTIDDISLPPESFKGAELLYAGDGWGIPGTHFSDPQSTPLPVTNGLRAHYNASSWQSTTVWEDLSGNNRHMENVSSGPSEVVSAENANMTNNTTGSRFAYVRGDQNSRWNLGGLSGDDRMPINSWTVIHIHRYDPVYSDKSGRVLGLYGSNALFGTYNGYSGGSYHKGWVGGQTYAQDYGFSRYDVPWLFHIERPNKFSRTTTLDDNGWTDFSGGGDQNMSWRPTISAGQENEYAAWNIAELIIFDRVLSDSEVEQFKTWMMAYKTGARDSGTEDWQKITVYARKMLSLRSLLKFNGAVPLDPRASLPALQASPWFTSATSNTASNGWPANAGFQISYSSAYGGNGGHTGYKACLTLKLSIRISAYPP